MSKKLGNKIISVWGKLFAYEVKKSRSCKFMPPMYMFINHIIPELRNHMEIRKKHAYRFLSIEVYNAYTLRIFLVAI